MREGYRFSVVHIIAAVLGPNVANQRICIIIVIFRPLLMPDSAGYRKRSVVSAYMGIPGKRFKII